MPFPAGSLEDVEAWAKDEFPAYFAAVTKFSDDSPIETLKFDGELIDGRVVLQPILIRALGIGIAKPTTNLRGVVACLKGNSEVELFYNVEYDPPEGHEEELFYIAPVTNIAEVELYEPFARPIMTEHLAGLDRLETLIRYFFLKHGEKNAVQPKLGFFKTHFRAACRDVARATSTVSEADEMDDDETLPDDTPPDLIADTDVAGLRNNPAATSIFRQHVDAMDESYHDFKTGMLRQLAAMQATDQNNMAQLQAQNQDLERKLTLAEQALTKVNTEWEADKAKMKTATEEAAAWKTQYEGLKETLQSALGQRF